MLLYYMSQVPKKELNESVPNNINQTSEINNFAKSFNILNISNNDKDLIKNKYILHEYNYTKILDNIFNVDD